MKSSAVRALWASAFLFSANAVAQTSEPPVDPSLANPTGSTSSLYTALNNSLRIGQGENLDIAPTLGSMEALGYITGVRELLSVDITQPQYRICVPGGLGSDALERIVIKFIDAHPQSYSWPPSGVVVAAYLQAFPCHK
jgi:hypothetical protein